MRTLLLALAVGAATLAGAPPSHAWTLNCQLFAGGSPDEYEVYAGPLPSGGVTSTTTYCDFKWDAPNAPVVHTSSQNWPGAVGFISGVRLYVTSEAGGQVTPWGTKAIIVSGHGELWACARTYSPQAGMRSHGCAYLRSF